MSAVEKAFAEAGVDLEDLKALEHAQRAKALNTAPPVAKPVSFSAPEAPVVCNRCKKALKDHEEWVCDACEDAINQTLHPEAASPAAHVAKLGDCWPRKHIRMMASFHGDALACAQRLFPHILNGGMLLVHGKQGRGKTGMATWWEWQRLQLGKKAGMFDTVQGVFARIKASWATKTTDAVIRELERTPYLVLDELDERAASEWEEYTLFDLINRRYNDEAATVLISNLSTEELQKAYKPKFLSRISENGGLVPCNWESYRL